VLLQVCVANLGKVGTDVRVVAGLLPIWERWELMCVLLQVCCQFGKGGN